MTTRQVKRGDIYYVTGTAETTGSEQGANRPAVIVSNDKGNRYAPVVEIVYLTTRSKAGLPTHVYIGSAPRPSIALCEQIVTVCKSRLERHIGAVTAEEMQNIDTALGKSLGIHKTGGQDMQITMITPFGEMKFDMPPEKATDLMQRAFQYAAGQEAVKETTEVHIPAFAPGGTFENSHIIRRDDAQELVVPTPPKKKPVSRVERMFGDFRKSEPEDYKGFLLIRCEECGKLKGFCAKQPISEYRCDCGHTTKLHDLKAAHLKCKCGSQFTYNTNINDEQFDYPCLHCGSPVDLALNRRGDTYVTVE